MRSRSLQVAQVFYARFAGLIDLAIKKNSLIGGDDFKSGQTKMKSVLVDFLVGAGIKVYICKYIHKYDM